MNFFLNFHLANVGSDYYLCQFFRWKKDKVRKIHFFFGEFNASEFSTCIEI